MGTKKEENTHTKQGKSEGDSRIIRRTGTRQAKYLLRKKWKQLLAWPVVGLPKTMKRQGDETRREVFPLPKKTQSETQNTCWDRDKSLGLKTGNCSTGDHLRRQQLNGRALAAARMPCQDMLLSSDPAWRMLLLAGERWCWWQTIFTLQHAKKFQVKNIKEMREKKTKSKRYVFSCSKGNRTQSTLCPFAVVDFLTSMELQKI